MPVKSAPSSFGCLEINVLHLLFVLYSELLEKDSLHAHLFSNEITWRLRIRGGCVCVENAVFYVRIYDHNARLLFDLYFNWCVRPRESMNTGVVKGKCSALAIICAPGDMENIASSDGVSQCGNICVN